MTTPNETCQGWCSKPAYVVFRYLVSEGLQTVRLCKDCATRWQKDYHATPAGLSLCIVTLEQHQNEQASRPAA